MPRAPTIAQVDVDVICNRLSAAGIGPSVRKIIEEHGSGSQGTVYPLFENWKLGQPRPSAQASNLPPALQRMLQDYIGQETRQAKAALETQLEESKQIAADLARENDRQANEIDLQKDAYHNLIKGMAGLQGRIKQLENDSNSVHEQAIRYRNEAERARTDLKVALLRLEVLPRLEVDMDDLRAQCEIERRARVAAEQDAAVARAQKDGLAERLADVRERDERDRQPAPRKGKEARGNVPST